MEPIPYAGMRSARTIGQAINDARRTQGLTQAELAAEAGISREAMLRIERGARLPRMQTLIEILRALRYDIMFMPRDPFPSDRN